MSPPRRPSQTHEVLDTEEATVIDVLPEQGLIKLHDQLGHEFIVRPRGSYEQRSKWFQNPELIMDKPFIFQFQGRRIRIFMISDFSHLFIL